MEVVLFSLKRRIAKQRDLPITHKDRGLIKALDFNLGLHEWILKTGRITPYHRRKLKENAEIAFNMILAGELRDEPRQYT